MTLLQLDFLTAGAIAFGFFAAQSATLNEPPAEHKHVQKSTVGYCIPDNEMTISQMTLQRDDDGNLFLQCEKHESLGYGKVAQNIERHQIDIVVD